MANWRTSSKGTQRPGERGTALNKTPRRVETHPGHMTYLKGTGPSARIGKGSRRAGVGAKNKDLRAKM